MDASDILPESPGDEPEQDRGDRRVASRPLRIALIGSRGIPASYSGFETFYEQLGVRLVERGHEVVVYNRSHHVPYRGTHHRGVRLVRLPSIATKHLDTLSHTALSLLHASFGRYDLIYVCIVGNSPLLLWPRLLGKPVILNVDGADHARAKWGRFASWYLRLTERIACRLASVIVADSQAIVRRYREEHAAQTTFIAYGANPWPREREAANRAALERHGLSADGYILFVSRLTPENGAHLLIDAFKRADTGLELVIVGDAPYSEEYKRRLAAACDERVVMTGYAFDQDYRELSCHCRFFVLPSRIDGTRPVLLDQMGFGNCALVADAPATREVVADAAPVYPVDEDGEGLVRALERLARAPEEIEHYRRAAALRVAQAYSWDAVTDRYEALFRRLVD